MGSPLNNNVSKGCSVHLEKTVGVLVKEVSMILVTLSTTVHYWWWYMHASTNLGIYVWLSPLQGLGVIRYLNMESTFSMSIRHEYWIDRPQTKQWNFLSTTRYFSTLNAHRLPKGCPQAAHSPVKDKSFWAWLLFDGFTTVLFILFNKFDLWKGLCSNIK